MSDAIETIEAWEVLDSRGNPTVRTRVATQTAQGTFTVPAGASTGAHEAVERRDGGSRYDGLGVSVAVEAIHDELAPLITGRRVTDQAGIDATLVEHDGTSDLSRVGANAILGVSGGVARAGAASREEPLYRYLAEGASTRLPMPMINLLSGGAHASGGMGIQDILVIPRDATSIQTAIESVWQVRHSLREHLEARHHRPLVADEGGFAPALADVTEAFDLIIDAIRSAGFQPSREHMAIAVDVAASQFYDGRSYKLAGRELTTSDMIDRICSWTDRYPIISLEDPLAEDDWDGWQAIAERLGPVQLLGDDLVVTDRDRLDRAIDRNLISAVLVKPNQAGTITRAIEVATYGTQEGIAPIVSARSGETCDSTIVDLAIAVRANGIKIGSLARSERLAKYNRLLELSQRDSSWAIEDGVVTI